jgi:hypothetical protein
MLHPFVVDTIERVAQARTGADDGTTLRSATTGHGHAHGHPLLCFIQTLVPADVPRASLNARRMIGRNKLSPILLEVLARIKTLM